MSAENVDLTPEQLSWLKLLSTHRARDGASLVGLPPSIERFLVSAELAHYFPDGSADIEITFKGLAAIRRQRRARNR